MQGQIIKHQMQKVDNLHKKYINLQSIIQTNYKQDKIRIKMLNPHAILKEELKKIASSMNKKYSTLRKQVLKTVEVFDSNNLPVFPYEVCFGLFRHVIETASLSSSMQFFPFIQAIINLGFCNSEMSREILTMLLHTKSIPKFQNYENQTKLQQILAMLISKRTIELKNIGFVHSLMNLFLSLENSKYRTLWTKTTSSFSQIVMLFTNEIRDNPSEDSIKEFNGFFMNLIRILRGQKVQWVIQFVDPYLFMQMFSEILDEKYFQENSSQHRQILQSLIPILHKQLKHVLEFNNNSTLSPLRHEHKFWELSNENKILILLRVIAKISILLKQGFQILEQLIKITTQKKTSTIMHYAYETLNFLFRNHLWMHALLQSNFTQLFNFLLTTEFNAIKMIFSEHKEKVDLVSFVSSYENGSKKIMHSNLIDLPSFQFNFSYEVRLIIKHLEQVTDSLYSIYDTFYKIDLQKKLEGKQPLQKTYKFCQKSIFETIKTIMPKQMSEDILQSLLKISEKFINLSGCFSDITVSALYIKMMCKYCLPSEFKNIAHRHVQINKMVLNTVNCLGHLLTSSCWVIVWKALQNYSIYYNRYLLGKQQLQAARESDVQILYKSMDSIFTETPKYDNDYLLEVIQSLIQVAYECLENNYNDETRKIFAFQRIEQIYRLNLFRINVIWPELSSSLLCITTSKVLYFRVSALNLLNTLIPLSLSYLKNHEDSIKEPLTVQNYESLILEPWINLVNCQFQEIKEQFIIAVNKLIIDYGHIMKNGWQCVLQIVKKTHDLKSLQAIVETFLQKVHDNTMDILKAVDALQRQLHDTNQKYLCLTMIWSIGDYAHKNGQNDVLQKIYQILLVPEQMFNLGTEARHSSFYIFAQIIVHNCSQTSQTFWSAIFAEVKNFYEYGIKESLKAKDKQFVEQALKNMLTNLIKVYKKFFLVTKNWESKEYADKVLGEFYLFCQKILEFRSPQLYQSVVKQTKQILFSKQEESLRLPQFYQFLQAMSRIYYVQNDTKILKCLITYLPAQIYDFLGLCAIAQGLDNHFITIYRLIQKIFLLRLEAIEAEIKLQQLRIFFEEKHHYEFMKKINIYVNQKNTELISLYTENLSKTIHKLELYNDYGSIFKSLPFLTSTHIRHLEINSDIILDLLKQLVLSRSDENWLSMANSYKQVPIWYMGVQDMIKIGHEYTSIQSPQALKVFQFFQEILFEQIEQKLEFLTQEKLSQYYQAELQICHFMIQNYLLNSLYKNLPEKHIIQISQFLAKRSHQIDSQDFTKKAINAYTLMFRLSKYKKQQEQFAIQRQQLIVQILLKRIMSSLNLIDKQHKQTYDFDELKFVMTKLLDLEINTKILKNLYPFLKESSEVELHEKSPLFRSQFGHLIYLQPYFCKAVKLKDPQISEIVSCLLMKSCQVIMGLEY